MEIKEFLKSKGCWSELDSIGITTFNNVKPEDIIEFTRYHVQEALKEVYNNSEMRVSENDTNEYPSFTDNYDDGYVTITISKKSILKAYPPEQIK